MDTNTLAALSDQIASIVDRAAPSVVQVHGRRRPVSGVAYAKDIIITNARALGRSDAVKVNAADGRSADGELAGWDPATGLAAIKVEGLGLTPFVRATGAARPGHIAIAIGRSWSNAVTASTGIVAVVGGPLRTGHGRQIDQIIRVTAPMHGGFAGGAAARRGGPTDGHWHGGRNSRPGSRHTGGNRVEERRHTCSSTAGRGPDSSASPVRRCACQSGSATASGRDRALLVVDVNPGGPAESGGVIVGDVILDVDTQPVRSTDDLLALLTTERVGRDVALRVLRGGTATDLTVTIGERPAS